MSRPGRLSLFISPVMDYNYQYILGGPHLVVAEHCPRNKIARQYIGWRQQRQLRMYFGTSRVDNSKVADAFLVGDMAIDVPTWMFLVMSHMCKAPSVACTARVAGDGLIAESKEYLRNAYVCAGVLQLANGTLFRNISSNVDPG